MIEIRKGRERSDYREVKSRGESEIVPEKR